MEKKTKNFEHFTFFKYNSSLYDNSMRMREIELEYPRVTNKMKKIIQRRKKKGGTLSMRPGTTNLPSTMTLNSVSNAPSIALTNDLSETQIKVRNPELIQEIFKKKEKRFNRFKSIRSISRFKKRTQSVALSQFKRKSYREKTKKFIEQASKPINKYLQEKREKNKHKKSGEVDLKSIPDLKTLVPEWTDSQFLKKFNNLPSEKNTQKSGDIFGESINQSFLFRTLDNELENIMSQIYKDEEDRSCRSQVTVKKRTNSMQNYKYKLEEGSAIKTKKSKRDQKKKESTRAFSIISGLPQMFTEDKGEAALENLKNNLSKIQKNNIIQEKPDVKTLNLNVLKIDSSTRDILSSKMFESQDKNDEKMEKISILSYKMESEEMSSTKKKEKPSVTSIMSIPNTLNNNSGLNYSEINARKHNKMIKSEVFPKRRRSFKSRKSSEKKKKKQFSNTLNTFDSSAKNLNPIFEKKYNKTTTWANYKSVTSIMNRKVNITNITTKLKYLRKKLTAASYLVHDLRCGKTLIRTANKTRREMASLTKMATFYTVFNFFRKYDLDLDKTLFEISFKAAHMRGTSAKLRNGVFMSAKDLLYGLMLPSGNDAAICLAENVGRLTRILNGGNVNPKILNYKNCPKFDSSLFVDLMNDSRKDLGLSDSFFMNPHGLNSPKNFSTCDDLLKLSIECLKLELFKEIVRCKEYKGVYYSKRPLALEKKENFVHLKKIDVESAKSSKRETPNLSLKYINSPNNLSMEQSQLKNSQEKRPKKASIISIIDSSREIKMVRFSETNMQKSTLEINLSELSFDFSKISGKSILRNKNQVNDEQADVETMYNQGHYLVNRRKKNVESKVSKMGVGNSKRAFYNKMRGMFIVNMRKKKSHEEHVQSELRKIVTQNEQSIPRTPRGSIRSNKWSHKIKWIHSKSLDRGSVRHSHLKNSLNNRTRSNSRTTNETPNRNPPKNMNSRKPVLKSFSSRRAGQYRKQSGSSRSPIDSKRRFKNLRCSVKLKNNSKQREFILNVDDSDLEKKESQSPVKRKEIVSHEMQKLKSVLKEIKGTEACSVREIHEALMQRKKYSYDEDSLQPLPWKNSNILLGKNGGYQGIKTGNTPNAKYCLASLFEFEDHRFVTSKGFLI